MKSTVCLHFQDSRAFIIGSLQRLTGSVIILTIEIITGSRDDLIVTTKINVFVLFFCHEIHFSVKTHYYYSWFWHYICCAISRNFGAYKEKKSLKTLILLLRMMSSRLCAMSQFIYLPIFKKNLFPCNILTFLSTHAFMAGYLYFIVRKKMSATRVCKMIYQNRKIHSVYPNLSKKVFFICKTSQSRGYITQ